MGDSKNYGKCFVIAAPSGAGKTTLMNKLIEDDSGIFYNSVSDTTRSPRPGEINGRDYNFITIPEFESGISRGKYLEWADVHGNFYGTPKTLLFAAMNSGLNPLLVLDVQGYFQMRDNIPYEKLCSVFIFPPDKEELARRIKERGVVDKSDLELRLRNSKEECAFAHEFKYCLTNDDFDVTSSILKFIIEKEIGL